MNSNLERVKRSLFYAIMSTTVSTLDQTLNFVIDRSLNNRVTTQELCVAACQFVLWGIGGFFIGIQAKRPRAAITGLLSGGALGVLGYFIIGLVAEGLWYFGLFLWWILMWVGLGLIRNKLNKVSIGTGAMNGLSAGVFSVAPLSISLVLFVEPGNPPYNYVGFAFWWWITFLVGYGILFLTETGVAA